MATTTRTGTIFGKNPVISADGRYVAYVSTAKEFTNDTNDATDVILEDLATGKFYFVSVSSNGVLGNRDSSSYDSVAISPDGRFLAFSSDASNLVPNDTNGEDDLFLHDTVTGTTTRLSLDANNRQSPANVLTSGQYRPSISTDGRFVAFQSEVQLAGSFTVGDDIFVRDVVAQKTTIVSVSSSGEQGNSASFAPSISGDGRFVVFESISSNLVSGDREATSDIFIHDRLTGITSLVSVNSQGQKGSGVSQNDLNLVQKDGAYNAVISGNGRFVVFEAGYTNLVPGDTNGVLDVFMRDLKTGRTTRVSVGNDGNQGNGSSRLDFVKSGAVSPDGRYVVFQSVANNLVPGDTNNALDVFVRDTVAGTTTRVSVNN